MSEFSRETLLNIIETDHVQCGEASALARMALAATDSSESVELPLDYLQGHKDGLEWAARLAEANHPDTGDWLYDDPIELAKAIRKGPDMPPVQPVADSEPVIVVGDDGGDALSYRRLIQSFEPGTKLYRHAQPASEREQVRSAHAEWSQATFGNVGPVGPLKHLSKEALEAAEQPGDLSEWADMQFLMWDAQRRAGITDEQITQAMIEKLAVNKQRSWPEPKDGEPRLHIKEQPAPVVQEVDADDNFYSWFGREWRENYQHNQYTTAAKQMLGVMAESAWKAGCRAAMLAAAPQSPGSEPATVPGKWIPVSERMPEDEQEVLTINKMGHRFVSFFDKHSGLFFDRLDAPAACCIERVLVTHWMPLPAAPQEVKP
ncbi:TPA: dATP/dGTP pyrophosphohydrolase domain-containing protein [Klebsiella pneumoniae]